MLSEKNPFVSSETLHERLKASAKSVLLKSIKFKEAMHPDEEEQSIKEKYKPINPQFQQSASGSGHDLTRNGHMASPSTSSSDITDDMPSPKVILFPPENVELAWKETRRIGPGLCNLGNTCFLNSVLQALTYTAPLVNFISSDTHRANCESIGFCMLCELRNHFFRVLKHNPQAGPIRPLAIVQKLSYIGKQFKFGRQEDAHEFLRYVIEGLQKSCLAGKPKLDKMSRESTVMNQIFGGFYRSQVICLACKHKSNTYDPMLEMNLDIKESNSIENALRRSVRPERLDGENKYQCDRCRGKRPAIKRSTIHKSPNVFTVQFKRFDFNRIIGGKVTKYVAYSEELNLRPFMSTTEGQPVLYGLYAVLVHSGFSCNSGHYYCYVKAPSGAWYEMNDSRVSQVSLKTVLNTEAYLLFYIRKQSRNKKVLNGDARASQVTQGGTGQTRPSPVQGGKYTSHGQQAKETPKESRPCPKMIPLNFSNSGKLSFKFSKSNSLKDALGSSSKLVENIPKGQSVGQADGTQSAIGTPKDVKRKPFVGLGSMESLKVYSSDESSEEVPEKSTDSIVASTAKSKKDSSQSVSRSESEQNIESKSTHDTNSDKSVCTATKSNKKFASFSSTERFINKIKHMAVNAKGARKYAVKDARQSERKGAKECDSNNTQQCQAMDTQQSEDKSVAANESAVINAGPRTSNATNEENKENVSSNPCTGNSENDTEYSCVSSPKSEHLSADASESKGKLPRSFIKSALFSPPQIPSMKSWIRSKNAMVPRSIFKRSISEPAASGRKINEAEGTQPAVNGKDCTAQGTKWFTLERQRSEHLFGPMTPPLKENHARERTNSINSEASSVASVSSKVGEWEVHEKEHEEVPGAARIPQRQFAGWDVVEQEEDDTKSKNFSQCNGNVDKEDTDSKVRKPKKKKKKRKRKRVREKDPERTTLVAKTKRKKRKMEEADESEEDEEVKKPKRKKKKPKVEKDSVQGKYKTICKEGKKDSTKRVSGDEGIRERCESANASCSVKRESTASVDNFKSGNTRITDSYAKEERPERVSLKNKDLEQRDRNVADEKGQASGKYKGDGPFSPRRSNSREKSSSRENSVVSNRSKNEERDAVADRGHSRGKAERDQFRKSSSRDRSSSKEIEKERLEVVNDGCRVEEERRPVINKSSEVVEEEGSSRLESKKKPGDSVKKLNSSRKRKLKEKRKAEKELDHSGDSSDSTSRYKISHKKKRRKHGSKNSKKVEEPAMNGRYTKHDKDVPVKIWDDNRSVVGSAKKSDIVDSLFSERSRALGHKVKRWDGGDNEVDSTKAPDERRQRRDKWDDEYDEGRKKKLKRHHKPPKTKHRGFSFNPFQRVQNVRNNKESA